MSYLGQCQWEDNNWWQAPQYDESLLASLHELAVAPAGRLSCPSRTSSATVFFCCPCSPRLFASLLMLSLQLAMLTQTGFCEASVFLNKSVLIWTEVFLSQFDYLLHTARWETLLYSTRGLKLSYVEELLYTTHNLRERIGIHYCRTSEKRILIKDL